MTRAITARTVILFGWLTVIFWVTTVVPPLLWLYSDKPKSVAHDLVEDMLPEFKALDSIYESPEKFEAWLRRSYGIEFAKGLVISFIGVVSGVLLIARRRAGRLIAISLCSFVFLQWLTGIIRFAIHTSFSPIIFRLVTLPGGIQEQVVNPMFFVFTVVLLTRKSVGRQLRNASN